MSFHIPASFAVPGIAVPACAAALIAAVWSVTLERIGYERAEEITAVQRANASVALAYAERSSRLRASGRLSPESFAAFGDELELGAATEVELIGLDGRLYARRAADHAPGSGVAETAVVQAAREAPHGSLVSAQGVPRYISYRVLRDYPMLVAVATSVQHTLRAFHARERDYVRNAWIASVLIGLLGAGVFVAWLLERSRDEQFRQLAGSIPEAFWVVEAPEERALYLSPAFAAIAGFPARPLARAWPRWKALIHPDDRPRALAAYGGLALGRLEAEHRIVRPDGEVRWVRVSGFPVREATGESLRIAGTIEDITERKRALEALLHQAHYDALTDLPNRIMCFDRLSQALGQARRRKSSVAALFFDLDRFKTVNDTLGHAVGDALLRETARRLTDCVRAGDTVARVGGDEFVVILSELARPEDARAVAQKMIDSIAQPMALEGREVFISASIGIAVFPADGEDGDALVKNADAAMFSAKEAGRNNYRFYTAAMNERAMQNLLLENDLRRALERDEFRIHFQPKQDLASGRLAGFEALLRWQHPARGLIGPAQFVPLLEDSGLIVRVGEWTLCAVCAQIRAWQGEGFAPPPVAVNLVIKQFLHHDVVAVVDAALRDAGIGAERLEVEITESDAMERPEVVVPMLRRLKERGIRIAVDDFGTGYSSLAHLKRLPVDTLKIDRSFVSGLPDDPDDVPIARAIVAMGHTLGLKIIAEGVENAAQRAFLKSLGCNELQGFLYSGPLSATECRRFLVRAQDRSLISLNTDAA
jgi:diguanylate cyclase (GGDEF)-like protein/PAS domain S-box-containing protein